MQHDTLVPTDVAHTAALGRAVGAETIRQGNAISPPPPPFAGKRQFHRTIIGGNGNLCELHSSLRSLQPHETHKHNTAQDISPHLPEQT